MHKFGDDRSINSCSIAVEKCIFTTFINTLGVFMRKNFILKVLVGLCFLNHVVFATEDAVLEEVYLNAPNLSDSNILGYTYGVRPYRKSGIRLEADSLGHKILVHNYGYGGSGITLCWGGAQETLRLIQQEIAKRPPTFAPIKTVAVLGAGAVGLTTAYELLLAGYEVSIYADAFSPFLTSNVAAAVWSPPALEGDEQQQELLARLTEISEERVIKILNSDDPELAGVVHVTGYTFREKVEAESSKGKWKKSFVETREPVIVHFDNGLTKKGIRYKGFGFDGKVLMDDLYQKVIDKGGKIYQRHFEDSAQVEALEQEIIVNCTSLGSRELFNDNDFVPIRGHMVYITPQEGVDYAFFRDSAQEANYWVFFYPWSDRLIIGGVYEVNEHEPVFDPVVAEKIIQNAREAFTKP